MAKSPNSVDKHVGNMLRMRRLMLGMSQAEVADGIGVTFQQVQKYEKGTNRISASRLQRIGDLLQVPPHFFFDDLSDTKNTNGRSASALSPNVAEFLSTSDGLRLMKAYTGIKDGRLKQSVVRLVDDLAE